MNTSTPLLSAMSDSGSVVDWWFVYKVAGKAISADGTDAKGDEYVYFDAAQNGQIALSPHRISSPTDGAVANTLNQIYNNKDPNVGWFFYNDENPISGKTNGSRGHTKGVLCFNTVTNSAFWLIQSSPKFPSKAPYNYPTTAMGNAQTFLCITLKDADTARAIAQQMFVAQQPNVYLASKVPPGMDSTDPRAQLLNNKVTTSKQSYGNFITFQSRAGQSFKCIAKNKFWDKAGDDDFYNDLVGPALSESLEVETWEHDPEPGNMDDDKVHTVTAMKSVNLGAVGIKPPFEWSEENDHAKLAVSDPSESLHYVCVGDLNFTVPQRNRSGGTVAFINDALWKSIVAILSEQAIVTNKNRR